LKTIEEILAAQQAIVDAAKAETRSLTDAEAGQFEALEDEMKSVQRTQQIEARQAAYVAPNASLAAAVNVGAGKTDDTLERAFDHYLRTGRENADIAELRAQGVGTDAAGGFTVPDTLLTKITDRMKAFGGVANAVETITTTAGETLRWPTLDDTSNSGVIAAEGTAPGSGGADLVFGEKTLAAFKYVAPGASQLPLRVSLELLQDSAFDVQGLVTRKLAERIARKQSVHWVSGAGTTEPFGISTGTAVATNTFDAAAPTYAELLNAVHQVDPAYRDVAVWTFNDATLAMIEGVVDGNGRPLLNAANDGINVGRANQTLLGYPVIVDQAWATYTDAGTNKFGAFGDLQAGYIIRRVQDVTLIVNPYSRANEGQVEYTLWARADGTVQDANAFRVLQNEVS
jgi:HK97 family phage major capsid protein